MHKEAAAALAAARREERERCAKLLEARSKAYRLNCKDADQDVRNRLSDFATEAHSAAAAIREGKDV